MVFHLVTSFNKRRNASHDVNQVSDYTTPQLPIIYEQCQQLMDMFKPLTPELECSTNQVSLTNQASTASIQGEASSNLIGACNFSITSQLYFLDTKHYVFCIFYFFNLAEFINKFCQSSLDH
jgi:hypothetical protein